MRFTAFLLALATTAAAVASTLENEFLSPEATELIQGYMEADGAIDDAALRTILQAESHADGEHRELFFNIDWSNLMFHIGACTLSMDEEAACTAGTLDKCHPGPLHKCHCCPDCKLPHSHKIGYCYRKNGGSSGNNGDGDGGGDNSGSNSVNEQSGVNSGNGQRSTRVLNLAAYIVGAAAVATIIGAVIWKKRKSDSENKSMGSGHSLSGSLARRLGFGGSGSVAADTLSVGSTIEPSAGPDFIEIGDVDPRASTMVRDQGVSGIEIEGPMVPSSNYAI